MLDPFPTYEKMDVTLYSDPQDTFKTFFSSPNGRDDPKDSQCNIYAQKHSF